MSTIGKDGGTGTRKRAATRKTAGAARAKTAVATAEATPTLVVANEASPEVAEAAAPAREIRKKALIERVVTRSGARKRDAKGVIEATLAELGEALSAGDALNLPGFGKATVNRQKDIAGGEVLIVKLRRGDGAKKAKSDPLAETGADG